MSNNRSYVNHTDRQKLAFSAYEKARSCGCYEETYNRPDRETTSQLVTSSTPRIWEWGCAPRCWKIGGSKDGEVSDISDGGRSLAGSTFASEESREPHPFSPYERPTSCLSCLVSMSEGRFGGSARCAGSGVAAEHIYELRLVSPPAVWPHCVLGVLMQNSRVRGCRVRSKVKVSRYGAGAN